ncbi:MAG: ribosome silencing factor [Nitrospirae bacterium]|nr:MAG: ribosome silencing factor [Nitrospirota bacterium]
MNSKKSAVEAARICGDKKANNILVLELKDLTVIADYFVICSGDSTTQVKAIAQHVERKLRDEGVRPLRTEGAQNAQWVLIDYGDVIVHIFEEQTRAYYELEKFWLDAPRIQVDDKNTPALGRKE